MSTTVIQEEPVTYESVLRLIKQQAVEFEQRLTREAAEREAAQKQREAERESEHERRTAEEEAGRKKREAEFERWKKEIRSEVSGIGKSNGEYAEQFFIRAMKRAKIFGGHEFNQVGSNWNAHGNDFDEEFDIVLLNGDSLVLLEVKYKFTLSDFSKFIGRKVAHFREFYTVYSDKKLYLGIAGFSFEKGVIEAAKKEGIGILHKDGRNIEYDDVYLKEF